MRVLSILGSVGLVAMSQVGVALGDGPIPVYTNPAAPVYETPSYPSHSMGHHNNPLVGTGYTPDPPVRSSRLGNWFRSCDACCWAHHNDLGCSNFKSEVTFIFGSCKAFYGERCLPKPLPVDRHGWWDRYGGY